MSATMTTPESDGAPDQIESLIITAFRMARDRGKLDWRRMTVAVLKNRMLQLSHGKFNESHHGASSFREFLSRYPQLVRAEGDDVELLEPEIVESATTEIDRIRPDLWQAIVDFASGKKYVWDASQGRAREALPEDACLLPTLSREEMATWRSEFVIAHGSKPALQRWRDGSLGTKALPQELQGPWNGFVRDKVIERLRQWFSSQGIPIPPFIQPVERAIEHESPVEQLRKVIAACVAVMTGEELAELRLPPSAVLRAQRMGKLQ